MEKHQNCFSNCLYLAVAALLCLPVTSLRADEDGSSANPYTLTTSTTQLTGGYYYQVPSGTSLSYDSNFYLGSNGTSYLTVSGGSLAVPYSSTNTLYVGYGSSGSSAAGYLYLTSGSVSAYYFNIGKAYGTGEVDVSGGTLSTTFLQLGVQSAASGTLNLTGGTTTVSWNDSGRSIAAVTVGYMGSGAINVSGGTMNVTNGDICVGGDSYAASTTFFTGVGTMTINSGSVSVTNTSYGNVCVGASLSSTGYLNMNGGTLTAAGYVHIGQYGNGTMNMTGGTITAKGINVAQQSLSHTGTVTMSGGTITTSAEAAIGCGGTGTFTMTGGTITNSGYVRIGHPWTDSSYGNGTVTVSGVGTAWKNTGTSSSVGMYLGYASASGKLYIEDDALVTASTAISIGSNGKLYIGGGYLAISASSDYSSSILSYLSSGLVYATNANGSYILLTSTNYQNYVTLTYYPSITTTTDTTLASYSLSGSYTVLAGLYNVPEPSTYALFGGVGALGMAFVRRRAKQGIALRSERG